MSDNPSPKNNNLVIGLVLILAGAGIGAFGYLHRPITGFGDALTRDVQWVFQADNFYYAVMAVAILCVLGGLVRVARNNQG
jgi:hypothetical protein